MKKSTKIHLVLLTAALASCNRIIIPDRPDAGYVPDPSLTETPVYDAGLYDCDCRVDTTYYNYPGYLRRWGAYWHNHIFVVRGGFGKAAASSAS